MEDNFSGQKKKLILATIALSSLFLVGLGFYFHFSGQTPEKPEKTEIATEKKPQEKEKTLSVRSAVLIDSRLYELVKDRLEQYIGLAKEKRGFEIIILEIKDLDDWPYARTKELIKDLREEHLELEGLLLVGNVKLPSFYKPRNDNTQVKLFSQYYADPDGIFSRIYEPGSIDPKCDGSNEPHCNIFAKAMVPEHDFDYMEKGQGPNPELWISLLPVGFARPDQNTYQDYAGQLNPFLEKAIKFYREELKVSKKLYKVSNQLWNIEEAWDFYGPEKIDFYGANRFYSKKEKPDGCCPAQEYCALPFGSKACYVRAEMENYKTFNDFWDYYQTRAWMGEDWQDPEIYKSHMAENSYQFVWVNVHSGGGYSLISTAEAKTLENGGLVMLSSGCSTAEFFQPDSPSFVSSILSPDENILISYLYGKSNFIAALGNPFNRGHSAFYEKLISFASQGDYLGQAFLKTWRIQYENSADPWDLRENSQEMLLGDPFLDIIDRKK